MITVVTPTYNRGHTLERLYRSLRSQTYREFEWVAIDDGSSDNTCEVCRRFKADANFQITYEYQKNSGKHVAINRAARIAQGEWFFIVDSDDWLPAESLDLNNRYLSEIESDASFAGVSGLCVYKDGSFVCNPYQHIQECPQKVQDFFKREYIDATSQEYRDKYKMPGDRAEIVRTKTIRRHPFPQFEGEYFLSEYFLWQSISDEGLKFRWFNKPTYYCEYLENGLTKNMRSVMRLNPLGRSFIDNFTLASKACLRLKLKAAVNYIRYGRHGGIGIHNLLRSANDKLLVTLSLPVALMCSISVHGEKK